MTASRVQDDSPFLSKLGLPLSAPVGNTVKGGNQADRSGRNVSSGVTQTTWINALNPGDGLVLGSDW